MNGKDLLDALNEIDEDFIVEVTKTDAELEARRAGKTGNEAVIARFPENVTASGETDTLRRPTVLMTVMKYAACAAVLAILVGGGLMIKNILAGANSGGSAASGSTPAVTIPAKEVEEPLFEEVKNFYEELVYNSKYYTLARTECLGVGQWLGSYELTNYMYIDEDEDPFGEEANPPESLEADVYEILGVNKDYAVAVRYPASDKYYVYSRVYMTDNFADLKSATQLGIYITPEEEFTVVRNGQNITVRTQITTQQALDTLFKNQDIPVFALSDMPNEFFKGTQHYEKSANEPYDPTSSYRSRYDVNVDGYDVTFEDESVPYGMHPAAGSPEAQAFCQGKEIGTLSVVAKVDNELLGWKGMNVYLYSGGWVVTNVYCIYVGPEAAADFLNLFEIPSESTVPET